MLLRRLVAENSKHYSSVNDGLYLVESLVTAGIWKEPQLIKVSINYKQ